VNLRKEGTPKPRLLLASGSPRRRELLKQLLSNFMVAACDVDETVGPGETPLSYVLRMATLKARAALLGSGLSQEVEWILGADTVVAVGEVILGKPRDAEDARRMLRRLQGRRHEVLTGLCLLHRKSGRTCSETVRTTVWMRAFGDDEIEQYLLSGESHDKAGGYAIQGIAGRFIEKIEGSYSNVVGLPLERLQELLNLLEISDPSDHQAPWSHGVR
jgi:septum formation protein